MSSLCCVIVANQQNFSPTFLEITWWTISAHRSEAWRPQYVPPPLPNFLKRALWSTLQSLLFDQSSPGKMKFRWPTPCGWHRGHHQELWGFQTVTVNRGRPVFHSVTHTLRSMCCQQRRLLSPQPLLLFRRRILNVPLLLQCSRWQTQIQEHASPSRQKQTHVQLHDAVFRIDDCVVLVKQ